MKIFKLKIYNKNFKNWNCNWIQVDGIPVIKLEQVRDHRSLLPGQTRANEQGREEFDIALQDRQGEAEGPEGEPAQGGRIEIQHGVAHPDDVVVLQRSADVQSHQSLPHDPGTLDPGHRVVVGERQATQGSQQFDLHVLGSWFQRPGADWIELNWNYLRIWSG